MKVKEGDKLSQYRMNKLLKGHTQKMWHKSEEEGKLSNWKHIALTTLFDGGQCEVISAVTMNEIQFVLLRSDTQQIRWVYNIKKDSFMRSPAFLDSISWSDPREHPLAPTPEGLEDIPETEASE